MFTGLVEGTGRIVAIEVADAGFVLQLVTKLSGALASGDSLAVNGVCLTVTRIEGGAVFADIGPETAKVTTLGGMRQNQIVNLERPMRGDGRFGGHFVQGHVDGTAIVEEIRVEGEAHWLTIGFDAEFAPYLIPKGSVALDGISLTIAQLHSTSFDVMIIPFTWQHTNLSMLQAGDRVNLECDLIGKYVVHAAELAGIRP